MIFCFPCWETSVFKKWIRVWPAGSKAYWSNFTKHPEIHYFCLFGWSAGLVCGRGLIVGLISVMNWSIFASRIKSIYCYHLIKIEKY